MANDLSSIRSYNGTDHRLLVSKIFTKLINYFILIGCAIWVLCLLLWVIIDSNYKVILVKTLAVFGAFFIFIGISFYIIAIVLLRNANLNPLRTQPYSVENQRNIQRGCINTYNTTQAQHTLERPPTYEEAISDHWN